MEKRAFAPHGTTSRIQSAYFGRGVRIVRTGSPHSPDEAQGLYTQAARTIFRNGENSYHPLNKEIAPQTLMAAGRDHVYKPTKRDNSF